MSAPTIAPDLSGLAPINGLQLYYESYGTGGTPLILLHGGYGMTGMFGDLASALATDRRVIAVDLQGHGRTADIDRPLSLEAMAGDIAALVDYLDLGSVDLMGYSLGGGVALQAAIDHPDLVRRLVLVSTPFSRNGLVPGHQRTDEDEQPEWLRVHAADADVHRLCRGGAESRRVSRPDGQDGRAARPGLRLVGGDPHA